MNIEMNIQRAIQTITDRARLDLYYTDPSVTDAWDCLESQNWQMAFKRRLLVLRSLPVEGISIVGLTSRRYIVSASNNYLFDPTKLSYHYICLSNGFAFCDDQLLLAREFVDFALSRLKLRKGQSLRSEKYSGTQVVEQSPIWRAGYLSALKELGLDPGGKVHKTIYFVMNHDPSEAVREAAKHCYHATHRGTGRGAKTHHSLAVTAAYCELIKAHLITCKTFNSELFKQYRRHVMRQASMRLFDPALRSGVAAYDMQISEESLDLIQLLGSFNEI